MPVTRSTGKGRRPSTETKQSATTGTSGTTSGTETTTTSSTTAASAISTTAAKSSATVDTGDTMKRTTKTTEDRAPTESTTGAEHVPPTARPDELTIERQRVPPTARPDAPTSEAHRQRAQPTDRQSAPRIEQSATEEHLPGPSGQKAPRARSAASVKSTKAKTLKIMKAKEELARLQVELATARLAVLEVDSEDDDVSVYSKTEAEDRVDDWLRRQPEPAYLPHQAVPEPPVATEDKTELQPKKIYEDEKPRALPVISSHKPQVKGQAQSDLSQLTEAITQAVKASRPRLMDLPIFNGSHQDWLHFRAAYFETEKTFSKIENVNRLRRNLKGKAKEAVDGLLITNAEPSIIMKTLESRFGRPDSIAMMEIDTLRALPRLNESPREICIFSSKVTNAVSTLQSLKCIYYLYNPEVAKTMIEKLTPTLRFRYYDFAASLPMEEPELLKFDKFLKREAELCGRYAQPEPVSSNTQTTQQKRQQRVNTVTEKQPTAKCPVCEETGHNTANCEKFKKVDESARWDIAKNRRLCFRCLRYRNKTHSCQQKTCGINDCKYYHHKLLHYTKMTDKQDNSDKGSTEAINSAWISTRKQSYLKIIPVTASGPAGTVETFALLDDGSTVTLIDDSITDRIGVTGPIDPLRIQAINDLKTAETKSRRVNITLKGVNQREERIQARTVKNLHVTTQQVSRDKIEQCEHLQDIVDILTYKNAKPGILIGQDNWHLLLPKKVKRGSKDQPVASLTPLGWVLHGSHARSPGNSTDFVNHLQDHPVDEKLEDLIKQHFAMDSLCINPKKPQTDPEEQALRILEKNTVHIGKKRYETALLWKTENINLPENYENSLKRLYNIEKKLDRDPLLKKKYTEQMEDLIAKGYAELAPAKKTENRTWYLPHFGVVNPMKPEKLRVVHDAAAKTKGVALNDVLLKGPDLLQSLPGVVMRFRQHEIAVTADIKEMFMQIKLRKEDRDALRYLWRGDRRDNLPPDEYRMSSLIFGASSSPSTAIFVKDLNAKKHEDKHPEAAAAIIQKHYVDDYLDSFKSLEDAIRIATGVRDIHKKASFELKQWKSNSPQLLQAIGEVNTQEDIELYKPEDTTERVLGLIWKPEKDELTFNLNLARIPSALIEGQKPTKREALRIVMSLFDPLGFASPVTIRAKQILQEVWRRGTPWDDEISEDLAEHWRNWLVQLKSLSDVAIPRRYLHYSDATSIQLHIFTDASEAAYSAIVFWRTIAPNGQIDVSLVIAKARVAPLKLTSIPRLELQAAVMGSRLAEAVITEHERKPDSKTFWTDSKTVLTWIKTGSRSYKPYVAHRIAAIEESSTVNEWRWIPTKMNVADDATRDVPPSFNRHHRWYKGPDFLYESEDSWPTEASIATSIDMTGEERVNYMSTERKQKLSEALPDVSRFSNWERLRYTTARVLQFIQLCRSTKHAIHYKRTIKNKQTDPDWKKKPNKPTPAKRSEQENETENKKYLPVTAELLERAEELLIKSSQEDAFSEEIEDIKKQKPINKESRLHQLSIEYEDEILRLRSRIEAVQEVPETLRRPAVVDGNHRIIKLWIENLHRKLHHAGVEATINECRQQYWILRVRPVTRSIIRQCLFCRMKTQTPPHPRTGDLPPCRLAHHQRPFSYTGVDYFGPLTVTVGRSHQKRYVAIFTCLTTRAIHLEVAGSLSSSSAIMALRRMMARRGCPTQIWSDNGTNLKAADKELRQAIDEATAEEAAKRKISWRFIPPGAPFMGGAWERMVRSVKTALKATLHERHPSEEVLTTLLTEAEYTVNSRPLTHVSVNPEDPEALTPNHFLLGGPGRVPVPGNFDDKDATLTSSWRAAQKLADIFWDRWIREYLPELQNRREPHGRGPTVKEGDLVQLVDPNMPRNTWIRGKVIATFPGPDNVVRTVDLQTKGGVLRRPVRKLVILPIGESVVPAPVEDATESHGGRDVQDDA